MRGGMLLVLPSWAAHRLAAACLWLALLAVACSVTAIATCWTWMLAPYALLAALTLGTGIAGWGQAARQPARWYGRLWAGGGLAILFTGFAVALYFTVGMTARERTERGVAANQLKALAFAVQGYYHKVGRVPRAAMADQDGKPLLSWRVAILPFLDVKHAELHARFKLDEPWDSTHNRALLAEMPSIFAAPHRSDAAPTTTVYQVFVGPGTPFDPETAFQMPATDLPVGPGELVLIVEAAKAVPWTKPEDLPYSPDRPVPPLGSVQRYAVPPTLFVPSPCRWMMAIDALGLLREGNLDTTDESSLRRSIARP